MKVAKGSKIIENWSDSQITREHETNVAHTLVGKP